MAPIPRNPSWELPLYRFAAGAMDAIGSKLKSFFGAEFNSVHVLCHRESRNRSDHAPVVVKTDRGQIEVCMVDIDEGSAERIGLAIDSIKMDGKDGKGRDLADLGYEWTALDTDELQLVGGHFISAIRLIGSELKGIEVDVSSKRVRGRIQIYTQFENCDDAFGLSIAFVQPEIEVEKRYVVCENMDWFRDGAK